MLYKNVPEFFRIPKYNILESFYPILVIYKCFLLLPFSYDGLICDARFKIAYTDWLLYFGSIALNLMWIYFGVTSEHLVTTIKMSDVSTVLSIIFASSLSIFVNTMTMIVRKNFWSQLKMLYKIDTKFKMLKFPLENHYNFKVDVVLVGSLLVSGFGLIALAGLLTINSPNLFHLIFHVIPTIQYSIIIALYFFPLFSIYYRYMKLNECFKHYFVDNFTEKLDRDFVVDDHVSLVSYFGQMHETLTECVDIVNFTFGIHVSC